MSRSPSHLKSRPKGTFASSRVADLTRPWSSYSARKRYMPFHTSGWKYGLPATRVATRLFIRRSTINGSTQGDLHEPQSFPFEIETAGYLCVEQSGRLDAPLVVVLGQEAVYAIPYEWVEVRVTGNKGGMAY